MKSFFEINFKKTEIKNIYNIKTNGKKIKNNLKLYKEKINNKKEKATEKKPKQNFNFRTK